MADADDLSVVVGATGTFGRAVTERLVKRGQRVLGVGRHEDDLAALAEAVPGVTPCVADIADDSAIEAIGAALDGPVRMAVFAAGLPIAGSVETVAPSTWPGALTSSSAGCSGWSGPSIHTSCRGRGS